jgi:hypothetical protein
VNGRSGEHSEEAPNQDFYVRSVNEMLTAPKKGGGDGEEKRERLNPIKILDTPNSQ